MHFSPLNAQFIAKIVAILAVFIGSEALAEGILPGQEESIAQMLGRGAELPAGCRWDGATIESDKISAWYRCSGIADRLLLRIAPGVENTETPARSQRFVFEPGDADAFPPALLSELVRRFEHDGSAVKFVVSSPKQVEAPDLRMQEPEPGEHEPILLNGEWPRGAESVLIGQVSLAVLSIGTLVATRRRRRPRPAGETGFSFVLAAASLFGLFGAWRGLSAFRFETDDQRFLWRALAAPNEWDEMSRQLSTVAHFRAGYVLAGGHPAWFITANALVLIASVLIWVAVLRRSGFRPVEAALGGALFLIVPLKEILLRSAAGIENLGAIPIILGTILLTLEAREETSRWRQVGFIGAALSLASLGMLWKYPWMVVLPPAVLVWHRWLAGATPPSGLAHHFWRALPLALVAAMVPPGWLIWQLFQVGLSVQSWIGWDRIPANLEVVWQAGRPWFGTIFLLWILLAVGELWPPRPLLAREPTPASAKQRLIEVLLWAVLAAVFIAPTLLNQRYYQAHYLMLAAAPLAALGARLIGWLDFARQPAWWQLVATAAALVQVFPAPFDSCPPAVVSAFVSEVKQLLQDRNAPDRIVLQSACDPEAPSPAGRLGLKLLFHCSGGDMAIASEGKWTRLRLGLTDEDAALPPRKASESEWTVHYCQGTPPRVEESPPLAPPVGASN
jgi:hypothetical protein